MTTGRYGCGPAALPAEARVVATTEHLSCCRCATFRQLPGAALPHRENAHRTAPYAAPRRCLSLAPFTRTAFESTFLTPHGRGSACEHSCFLPDLERSVRHSLLLLGSPVLAAPSLPAKYDAFFGRLTTLPEGSFGPGSGRSPACLVYHCQYVLTMPFVVTSD